MSGKNFKMTEDQNEPMHRKVKGSPFGLVALSYLAILGIGLLLALLAYYLS